MRFHYLFVFLFFVLFVKFHSCSLSSNLNEKITQVVHNGPDIADLNAFKSSATASLSDLNTFKSKVWLKEDGIAPFKTGSGLDPMRNYLNNVFRAKAASTAQSIPNDVGAFFVMGNYFLNQSVFHTYGKMKKDGTQYNEESLIPWASNTKILSLMVVGKALEDGYISLDEKLSKYWPSLFTGTAPAYSTWTSNNTADPSTWTPVMVNQNLDSYTIRDLVAFRLPFMLSLFSIEINLSPTTFWNNGDVYRSMYKQNEAYKIEYTNGRIFDAYACGMLPTALSPSDLEKCSNPTNIEESLANVIIRAKNGTTPLLFPRGVAYSLPPYNLPGAPSVYGFGMDIAMVIVDKALKSSINLRGSAYSGGGVTNYTRNKILNPLGMNEAQLIAVEPPLPGVNRPDCTFNRRVPGLVDSFFTNATHPPSNVQLWCEDYQNEYLSKVHDYFSFRTAYEPSFVLLGGGPMVVSIRQFKRLYEVLILGGKYNNVRIFSKNTVNWILLSKVSNLVTAATPIVPTPDLTGPTVYGWTGAAAKIPEDNTVCPSFFASSSTQYWTGAAGTINIVNTDTGYYFYAGTIGALFHNIGASVSLDEASAVLQLATENY